jgi:hypothetical protein
MPRWAKPTIKIMDEIVQLRKNVLSALLDKEIVKPLSERINSFNIKLEGSVK